MPKTIRQTVTIQATPTEVYTVLMDSKKHSQFTGAKASISKKVGGSFSTYDEYCYGINVELIEGKKIVQTWQANDWKKDEASKVTFTFAKNGKGTKLTFVHSGVPDSQVESIKKGWIDFYWTPLKAFFNKNNFY